MSTTPPVLFATMLGRVKAALVDLFINLALTVGLLTVLLSNFPEMSDQIRMAIVIAPFLVLEPVMLSVWGGTVGYWLFNQVLMRSESNEYLSLPRAFGRYILKILCGWFSLVFMLTSRRHQALHDIFADSVVRLRNVTGMDNPEGYKERSDDEFYVYPSPTRRVLVICAYVVVVLVLEVLSLSLFLSSNCFERDRCVSSDQSVKAIHSFLLFVGCVFLLVLGWRGRLFGCRRTVRETVVERDSQ